MKQPQTNRTVSSSFQQIFWDEDEFCYFIDDVLGDDNTVLQEQNMANLLQMEEDMEAQSCTTTTTDAARDAISFAPSQSTTTSSPMISSSNFGVHYPSARALTSDSSPVSSFDNEQEYNNDQVLSGDGEQLEKPKKPLSAYNLFFQAERKRLLRALPAPKAQGKKKPRNSHGKIGFADMARTVSARWKAISAQEKAPFDQAAKLDKERYTREKQAYRFALEDQALTHLIQQQQQKEDKAASPPSLTMVSNNSNTSFLSSFDMNNCNNPNDIARMIQQCQQQILAISSKKQAW